MWTYPYLEYRNAVMPTVKPNNFYLNSRRHFFPTGKQKNKSEMKTWERLVFNILYNLTKVRSNSLKNPKANLITNFWQEAHCYPAVFPRCPEIVTLT